MLKKSSNLDFYSNVNNCSIRQQIIQMALCHGLIDKINGTHWD